MSGVVGHTLGRSSSTLGGELSSVKYSTSSSTGGPPGEVRVALREADLREAVHHRRSGERLGQEDRARMAGQHLADQPLPEREGLGVGVVDAEGRHPVRAPEQRHLEQCVPEGAPRRWRSGRADRCPGSAWAGSRRTGSCRRAGVGTTRGDRGPRDGRVSTGRPGRAPPRSRARARRPPVRRSRPTCRARGAPRRGRPRASRWPTGCRDRRARPPPRCRGPCGTTCRSDGSGGGRGRRRPRSASVVELADHVGQGPVADRRRCRRARGSREELVPGREQRPVRLDERLDHHRRLGVSGREGTCGLALVVDRLVGSGRDLAVERVAPRRPLVDPRPNPERVSSFELGDERGLPAIEARVGRRHGHLDPALRPGRPMRHHHPQEVVPVGEHPRRHRRPVRPPPA